MTPEETWVKRIEDEFQRLKAKASERQYRATNFRANIPNLLNPWCRDAECITGIPAERFMPKGASEI